MSETADRLRELAETVEFVEDEQGKEVRDIDVSFVRTSIGPFSALVATIGGVEPDRVPVFDLKIAPGDEDLDEDDLEDEDVDDDPADDDVDEDATEIELEDDEDESAAEAAGEGEL